jgi:hypothetical protein
MRLGGGGVKACLASAQTVLGAARLRNSRLSGGGVKACLASAQTVLGAARLRNSRFGETCLHSA